MIWLLHIFYIFPSIDRTVSYFLDSISHPVFPELVFSGQPCPYCTCKISQLQMFFYTCNQHETLGLLSTIEWTWKIYNVLKNSWCLNTGEKGLGPCYDFWTTVSRRQITAQIFVCVNVVEPLESTERPSISGLKEICFCISKMK